MSYVASSLMWAGITQLVQSPYRMRGWRMTEFSVPPCPLLNLHIKTTDSITFGIWTSISISPLLSCCLMEAFGLGLPQNIGSFESIAYTMGFLSPCNLVIQFQWCISSNVKYAFCWFCFSGEYWSCDTLWTKGSHLENAKAV